MLDAVVIGSGPNGLAAAVELARAGRRVKVLEARDTIGGGCRSAELTLPGFLHDVCSTIHPLAGISPFFQQLPLAQFGLELVEPPAPLAHPFDDGTAAMLEHTVEATAANLGPDRDAYRELFQPIVADAEALIDGILGPLRLPRHPIAMARFGLLAIRSSRALATSRFKGERARGLFAGLSAHAVVPLEYPFSAAFGLVLALAGHLNGWPVARGGSQRIVDALAGYLRSIGGEIETGHPVHGIADIPRSRAALLDLSPREALRITGARLPGGYRRSLERFKYGPGAFKLDWALDGPIPWRAAECARAATVHLGGSLDEIAASERAPWEGRRSERPFVILAQQSPFDPSRAPAGKHTAWGYCHVPNGSAVDMTDQIERQVERFAPGFRELILARRKTSPPDLERYNPNYVGGDIGGGAMTVDQLFTRPAARPVPYATPVSGLYLCSASTPPGGGVHGMCGYFAARGAIAAGY